MRQRMICRLLSLLTLPAALAGVLVNAGPASGDPAKPNIIFILADDLGYADVGCYGQAQRKAQGLPAIDTPQIDRLAQEGVRFTQCYAGYTVCAPSRCSLMTGYHTGHARVRGNFGSGGNRVPLLASDVTVAEVLKPAGYYTALIGKWGLGDETPELQCGVPNLQGFDYFFGFLDQADAHNHRPDYLWENRTHVYVGGEYANDLFTGKALTFLNQHAASGPFFLYMAYTLPHGPHEVPDYGIYDGKPWTDEQKAYAAMITRLDSGIGQIMTRVQQLGLDQNTIVFFCSDNGPTAEVTLFDSNGPLRGYKTELYEGGIRVPMIVRWPNIVPGGVVSQETWAFWDVMPTLAELAGTSAPAGIDGISALSAVLGQPQPSRDHFYWEDPGGTIEQAIRLGDFKAVRKFGQYWELYNLAGDLAEATNVLAQNPLVQARMEQIMGSDRTSSDDWPIGPFCSGGASLDGVTVVTYAGGATAPQCAALAFAQEQVSVYTDSSRPIAAGGLPAVWQGGVLVQTSNGDYTSGGNVLMKLFLAYDATVAVGYRSNAIKPAWWNTDYSATGTILTVGGFSGGNRTFDVRTREVPAGGTVSIPGSRFGGGNADAGYVVIIQKKTDATTAPTVAMQPQSQTVKVGRPVTFGLVGCGAYPLSYQWEKRDSGGGWAPIPGAIDSSYSIPLVATSDAGTFRCVVSNAHDSATSGNAVLTVVPAVTLPSALAAQWKFDESGGNLAVDSSANGRDGTLSGPTRTPTCIVGSALSFDGVDDRVLVNYDGILGAQARSVCFWVKTTDLGGHAVVAWGDEQTAGGKWHVVINADPARGIVGAVGIEVGGGYCVAATNVADGRLHHVAAVLAGTDIANTIYYIDGRLDAISGTQSHAVNTVGNGRKVTIGSRPNGGSIEYLAGLLDDLRIYGAALSEPAIQFMIAEPPFFKMDLDRDCDVDQSDFGRLQICFANASVPPGCENADLDASYSVDQGDVVQFARCLSGAGNAPDPDCAN